MAVISITSWSVVIYVVKWNKETFFINIEIDINDIMLLNNYDQLIREYTTIIYDIGGNV